MEAFKSVPENWSAASVRILVVDDEPEIAESVSEFLARKEGYQVIIAQEGKQAMEILEESAESPAGEIDLVLLDVIMPLISGPEVLAWLRGHPRLKYTRVIMLTAAAGNEAKVEALTSGADDYITKPYYPLELLARVKTILRTQQLEKQLQKQSQQLVKLNQVSRAVAAKLAATEVLALAVEGVAAIFELELAAVFMVDDERKYLSCRQVYSKQNLSPGAFNLVRIGEGLIGAAYQQESITWANNSLADERFWSELDRPINFEPHCLMATPLMVRNQPVGVLAAWNNQAGFFSEVELGLFTSLASAVSRAVEVAWLFQSIQQRQQDLIQSRNMLQAVIDGILHPIYTIDEHWRLLAVNQTRGSALNQKLTRLIGQKCYQSFYGRQAPCDHCQAASTLSEGHAKRWSVSYTEDDQRSQEWDVSAYPIPGSRAGLPGSVIVWQDRTEERRLENSLMQAGKLAAIGQLAAGVAHEINNPLTAINANAQMLQMSIPPEHEDYEAVDLIVRAGDRAAQVVRGLLDFARQSKYHYEPADINDSISRALDLVAYQFKTANIETALNLAPDLPIIEASLEHLQSVWLNLLINARDALQATGGRRRVTVTTKAQPDRDQILIIVSDSGKGMTSAELDHIFEPFYTTKGAGEGTGLGLATCHRIVQQHGGQIEVASKPGRGTTFTIHLPVKPTERAIAMPANL